MTTKRRQATPFGFWILHRISSSSFKKMFIKTYSSHYNSLINPFHFSWNLHYIRNVIQFQLFFNLKLLTYQNKRFWFLHNMLIVLSLKHSPRQIKQELFCEGFIYWFHFRAAKGAVGASPYQNAAEIQEWKSENQVMPLGSLQVVSCLKEKTPSSQHSAPTPYFPS